MLDECRHPLTAVHVYIRIKRIFTGATKTDKRDIQPREGRGAWVVIINTGENEAVHTAGADQFRISRVQITLDTVRKKQNVVAKILRTFDNAVLELFHNRAGMVLAI